MPYQILVSGYRPTFSLLSFEPESAKLKLVADSPAPDSASWVEEAVKQSGPGKVIYSCSEGEKEGLAVSLKLDGDKVEVTSSRKTRGAPAHILPLKDGSGVLYATYMGGTVVYFPLNPDGTLSSTSASPDLEFPFPYKDHGPDAERQESPHLHQVLEAKDGKIYAVDLGSDRVWVIRRSGVDALERVGWLQLPEGAGPRHAVFSPDEKHLYVLTELTHSLFVFSLTSSSYPSHHLPDFSINIVPPTVPATHQKYMDSAEVRLNPAIPNVVYASNRWELHVKDKNPGLPEIKEKQSGDAVAVVLLSEDGAKVEEVKHVRTGCDAIRAMRVSPDGKYVALAGQEGGGFEVWQVGGKRGDEWKLAAKDESIHGVTDCLWL